MNAAMPGAGAGSLETSGKLSGVDPRLAAASALAVRITYLSTSGINDSNYKVTGAVFVPRGGPPPGGWPMVGFGHRATGIRPECAPSLSLTLHGEAGGVADLVKAGYVVVVPDYLGLGLGPGNAQHPFLDATTEAYNLIDSMSAVRNLVPETSDKWIAFGVGQGGQAAWAANELVADHGMGLDLVGAVSVSPAADLTGLADVASAGGLSAQQKLTLVSFLAALKGTYGDDIDLDDYRRGAVKQNWDELLACDEYSSDERLQLANQISADDLRPGSAEAVRTLRGFLRKIALPQGPTSAPMLVTYAGKDPLIPPAWTRHALDEACRMGDVIQIRFRPDKEAGEVDTAGALRWIDDRFKGIAAPNDCVAPVPHRATGAGG
jgi:acetyl esterase/lipase